jgi:hypothetical protein
MINQLTQLTETLTGRAKKGTAVKRLTVTGLVIVIAFTVIWLMMSHLSTSSRPSTPAEITAQEEFQAKLNSVHEAYQQSVDAATKETRERELELHKKTYTAQEEFLRKLDAASKAEMQKSDSNGK